MFFGKLNNMFKMFKIINVRNEYLCPKQIKYGKIFKKVTILRYRIALQNNRKTFRTEKHVDR